MTFEDILERARQRQHDEDNGALEDDSLKVGEGANTSAHLSPRGYIMKPVQYSQVQADNPVKEAEHPKDHVDRVRNVDRFPWTELEELDSDDHFDYARVKMEPWYMSHEAAVDSFHVSDVVAGDLEMFFEIREEGITYEDFKPDNIGYFQDDNISAQGIPVAKAIDITDGARKPWEEQEELPYRRFSDIMDVYIRGTPDEDGLTDIHPISVPEAEKHVMNYLGLETTNITGDPYKDLFQTLDNSQDRLDDILSY